jgi:hypothetical protein
MELAIKPRGQVLLGSSCGLGSRRVVDIHAKVRNGDILRQDPIRLVRPFMSDEITAGVRRISSLRAKRLRTDLSSYMAHHVEGHSMDHSGGIAGFIEELFTRSSLLLIRQVKEVAESVRIDVPVER